MTRRDRSDYDRAQQMTVGRLGHLLVKDHYWTLSFLRAFLQRIDRVRVDDPQQAHCFGLFAPELARQVPLDAERGGYGSTTTARIWQAFALAVLASAARAADRLDDAVEHLETAFEIAEALGESAPAWLMGQLYLRRGSLLGHLGDASGQTDLERALVYFQRLDYPERLIGIADIKLSSGTWKGRLLAPDAALDFAAAMEIVDRTSPAGRLRFDAAHANLLRSLLHAPHETRARALGSLRRLRTRMKGSGLRKIYVRWSEARLRASLYLHEEALAAFIPLRRQLLEKSTTLDYALISLDLLVTLHAQGRGREACALARETSEVLDQRETQDAQLVALADWLRRYETPAPEQLERRRIELLMRCAERQRIV